MKKIYALRTAALAAGFLLCGGVSSAQDMSAISSTSQIRVAGMSPDGSMAVGYVNAWENDGLYKSAVWTPADGNIDWRTQHNPDIPQVGGCFACVNDAGMIGGSIKDPKNYINEYDDFVGHNVARYFRAGAVWRDGKTFILPTPGFTKNDYTDENDGAAVAAISADGLSAAGNVIVAWMPMAPVRWLFDAESGQYEGELLDLPKSAVRGVVSGMSADGSVIVGTANADLGGETTKQLPCVWIDGVPSLIYPEEITTTTWCETIAVSQNGRWVVFGFSGTDIAELDLQTGEITRIPLSKTLSTVGIGAVDDAGDFVGQSLDADGVYSNLYYSRAYNVVCDLAYLMSQLEEAPVLPDAMGRAFLSGISADGTTILGVTGDATSQTAWWLRADLPSIQMMASVAGMDAFTSAPDAITVAWTPNPVYEGEERPSTLRFNLYVDGDLQASVSEDEAASGGYRCTLADLAEGIYDVHMTVTYLRDGREVESVPSEHVEVAVNSETSLPFFDDFEDKDLDPFLWTRRWEGVPGEIMTWGTVAGDDYENMSSHTQTFSISTLPYSNRITSRWMDASDASEVYISAYLKMSLLNFADQDLSHDFLDIEISYDGEQWAKAVSVPAKGMPQGMWDMLDADISALAAGRVFQLRLNSYGDGSAQIRWFMDLFKVGLAPERDALAAPLVARHGRDVQVHIPSSVGAYEAGYVLNSNLLTDYNIGNEGKDFIAAISLGNDQLADFDGMWLRGATAFVFDNPGIKCDPTTVEVMVWEDGVLVSSNMVDKTYTELRSTFFPLDEPVRIDASKEYKVGLGIYANHVQQTPIYYQCAESLCVPGRSDLFSEDGGETWQLVSEALSGDSRWCIWSIRADITPEEGSVVFDEVDPDLLGFNVFRVDAEGMEKVNKDGIIYAAAPRVTDWRAPEGAEYSVVAYCLDGDKTAASAPVGAFSAVEVLPAAPAPEVVMADGMCRVLGADVRSMSVYDASGRLLAIVGGASFPASLLAPGVNVLRVRTADSVVSLKIIAD